MWNRAAHGVAGGAREVYLGALVAKDTRSETPWRSSARHSPSDGFCRHRDGQEDIAVCMHLADAQEVLDKPGRISEILVLGCKCKTVNRVEEITEQLEAVLPKPVTEMRMQAIARRISATSCHSTTRRRSATTRQIAPKSPTRKRAVARR